MYGIGLIVVLIITGGVIAIIGDVLGYKMGKKRLSLFGLRPKHTSQVFTVLSGVAITALSLLVMSISSENVRTALFGLDQLNREVESKQELIKSLEVDLDKAKEDKAAADNSLVEIKAILEGLDAEKQELESEKNELEAGNRELLARYGLLLSENNQLLLSSQALKEGNEKLSLENEELTKEKEGLTEGIKIIREGDIAFRAGEILVDGVVSGKLSRAKARKDLDTIIAAATERAAFILNQRIDVNVTAEDIKIWINPDEYVETLDKLQKSADETVIRLAAAGNILRNEPISLRIATYPNFIVFTEGEEILKDEIHLTGTTQRIEEVLIAFMNKVNEKAIERGILTDPLSGAVGVIDGDKVYQAILELEKRRGKCYLAAYAKVDTDVQGPLRIEIKVLDE